MLAADADDVDDLWTTLKATRAGVVHEVISQTTDSAEIALASAAHQPLSRPATSSGWSVAPAPRRSTASAPSAPAATFVWLRADDHSRILAAHNPMPADQIDLLGSNTELRHLPGLAGEPVAISGVQLRQGAVNGALTRLVTLEIAQDTAVSFTPDSIIGMVHVFGHAALGDPSAAIFSYRADEPRLHRARRRRRHGRGRNGGTALTGTTGSSGRFTFSAHTDGKIYVENRLVGPPRTVSLFVIGAPL